MTLCIFYILDCIQTNTNTEHTGALLCLSFLPTALVFRRSTVNSCDNTQRQLRPWQPNVLPCMLWSTCRPKAIRKRFHRRHYPSQKLNGLRQKKVRSSAFPHRHQKHSKRKHRRCQWTPRRVRLRMNWTSWPIYLWRILKILTILNFSVSRGYGPSYSFNIPVYKKQPWYMTGIYNDMYYPVTPLEHMFAILYLI